MYIFVGRITIQILCPFKKLCCLLVELKDFFIYSGDKSFNVYMVCKQFLQECGLSFYFLNGVF